MMGKRLRTTLTDKRREWLIRLRDSGPSVRPSQSRVGFDCMRLGWTQWITTDLHTSEKLTWAQAIERYPRGGHLKNTRLEYLETITDKGLAALGDDSNDRKDE